MGRFRIELDPSACVAFSLGLLTLPVDWLLCWVLAASVHEAGHALAVLGTGGRIRCLRIGASGAVMEAELTDRKQEFISAIAGPAASLMLVLAAGFLPKIAACALLQGLYNLLPVYPLDGGRMLRCLASRKISRGIEVSVILLLFAFSVLVSVWFRLGFLPVLFACLVFGKAFLRKRPCKDA